MLVSLFNPPCKKSVREFYRVQIRVQRMSSDASFVVDYLNFYTDSRNEYMTMLVVEFHRRIVNRREFFSAY